MIQKMRGKFKEQKIIVESCGLKFTESFSHLKHEYFYYLLQLHGMYKMGNLPFEGPVTDQPAQIMDFFSLIDMLHYEREKREAEKYKQNNLPKK